MQEITITTSKQKRNENWFFKKTQFYRALNIGHNTRNMEELYIEKNIDEKYKGGHV